MLFELFVSTLQNNLIVNYLNFGIIEIDEIYVFNYLWTSI